MKLIPEWRQAWRFLSVQAATLLAVLSLLQTQVLPLWQFVVPPHIWPWISAGFGTLIIVCRLAAQSLPDEAQP